MPKELLFIYLDQRRMVPVNTTSLLRRISILLLAEQGSQLVQEELRLRRIQSISHISSKHDRNSHEENCR